MGSASLGGPGRLRLSSRSMHHEPSSVVVMQVTYSTYREQDYDAIWDRYAYQNGRPEWFQKVIAARTLPTLCPRRAQSSSLASGL